MDDSGRPSRPSDGEVRRPSDVLARDYGGSPAEGSPRHRPQQHHRQDSHDESGSGGVAGGAVAAGEAQRAEEEAKKARACEACRGLKVRCEPDLDDDTQPCKRCKKAGRNCIVTAPTRKRQKKTDSRVADLEKKIDALTATLQARAGSVFGSGPHVPASAPPPSVEPSRSPPPERPGSGRRWTVASAKTWHAGHAEPSPERSNTVVPGRQHSVDDAASPVTGQKRKERHSFAHRQPEGDSAGYRLAAIGYRSANPDFIERGLIAPDYAEELLNRYRDDMAIHLPAIMVPPTMTAAELSKSRPVLFSAIMASATSENPALQRTLQKELMMCFAEKVFLAGEKTLDTVQAILVAVIWYWPPENFEELKFYQLIHTASVMAIDIGLGRRSPGRRLEPPPGLRDPKSNRPGPPDPTSLECRRTWLTCYILATNAAMALHRPHLIRWSSFMAESLEVLETSPEALPTDKYFAHMVWAHKMAEDVANQFSPDDPDEIVSISDPRTQYALKGLERDWQKQRSRVSKDLQQPTLMMTFNTVRLYMHELVLNSNAASDQNRPPFSTESLTASMIASEPLSAPQISALSASLESIEVIFDTFLSIPVQSIRCLPVYFFVRIAYALVILMKMHFSASKPGSELGKVIQKEGMRVGFYLDALVRKFREAAAEERCRPAGKFVIVLAMLRSWFFKQIKETAPPGSFEAPVPPTPNMGNHAAGVVEHLMNNVPAQTNTPLHLLSEVATKDRSPASETTKRQQSYFVANNLRPIPQPFFAEPAMSGAVATDTPSTTTTSTGGSAGPDLNEMNTWVNGANTSSTAAATAATTSTPGFAPMPLDPSLGSMSDLDPEWLDLLPVTHVVQEPWFVDIFQNAPTSYNFNF